ncbi:MAG: amino acid ABC transporter permease [Candidatus Competibacterales bacterium]
MTPLDRLVDSFFNLEVMAAYAPDIMAGFWITCQLAGLIVVTGLGAGLVMALVRALGFKPLNALIVVFADVFRALPPLVIILLLYFALPYLGVSLSGFVATWLSLGLVLAAFAEESFWGGITAVPRGQSEAARSTGLGKSQTLLHVILPQAVRLTIAPLTNRTIAVTKGTALGSTVAVSEILYQATTAQSFSGNASPLMLGALAYIVLFFPFVLVGRYIETRFAWKRA